MKSICRKVEIVIEILAKRTTVEMKYIYNLFDLYVDIATNLDIKEKGLYLALHCTVILFISFQSAK